MKRFAVFFILLCLLTVSVSATNPEPDGIINLHTEYCDQVVSLQSERHESNNNVGNVFLYWFSSPIDYSVFLGLTYSCDDFIPGGGLTGVEVTVNNDLCCTVHADGTITDLDSNRFKVEFAFGDIVVNPSKEIDCEIRVGIKYGLDRDIEIGIRILDCSGNTSNYYRHIVYSAVASTTATTTTTTATTKPPKTTASTTEKTTKPVTKTSTSKPTETTGSTEQSVSTTRTVRPVITAVTSKEPTATTNTPSTEAIAYRAETCTAAKPEPSAKPRTTKPHTTKTRTVKQSTKEQTEQTVALPVSASAQTTDRTDEPVNTTYTEHSAAETTQTTAERYHTLSKVRLVGYVLVAILLTSVFFISIFTGISIHNKKQEDPPITPQEQHEDFG